MDSAGIKDRIVNTPRLNEYFKLLEEHHERMKQLAALERSMTEEEKDVVNEYYA